jgi:hypothetical protein
MLWWLLSLHDGGLDPNDPRSIAVGVLGLPILPINKVLAYFNLVAQIHPMLYLVNYLDPFLKDWLGTVDCVEVDLLLHCFFHQFVE